VLSTGDSGSRGNSVGQKVVEFEKIRVSAESGAVPSCPAASRVLTTTAAAVPRAQGDTSTFLALFNQTTSVFVQHAAGSGEDVS
jgi:hypothetical protein